MDRPLRLITASPVDRLARTIEALLVVASQPLSAEELAEAANDDAERVETALRLLAERFAEGRSGIVLEHVGGGWAFRASREAAEACGRLFERPVERGLSAAAMETFGVVEARRSPEWAVMGTPRSRPAAAPVRREVATVPARMTLRIQSSFRSTALGGGALWSHLRQRPVTGLPTGGPEGVRVPFACFSRGSPEDLRGVGRIVPAQRDKSAPPRSTGAPTWWLPECWLGKESPEPPLPVHALDVATFGMRGVVPQDAGQGENEGRRHLLAGHVLGRMQAKTAHARLNDHLALARPVPDPVVFHDNDPAPTTGLAQPDLVVCVLGKDIVMGDNHGMNLPEPVRNLPTTEAPVAEDVRRRAVRGAGFRGGWRLGPAQGSIRNLPSGQ